MSCSHSPSNASVSSTFAFLHHDTCYPHCVLMFAPKILPVATVELPPQNDELSNNTTLPSFSNSVLAADISAQPPPTRMAWSLFRPLNTSSISKSRERIGLCSVIRHVSGTSYSCHAAENRATLKRITTPIDRVVVPLPSLEFARCRWTCLCSLVTLLNVAIRCIASALWWRDNCNCDWPLCTWRSLRRKQIHCS